MIGLGSVYVLAGLMFGAIAWRSAFDRSNPKRWNNTGFWGLYAASFLFGGVLPDLVNGLLVLAMVVIGGVFGLGRGTAGGGSAESRRASAARFGNAIFVPALVIPAVALAGTIGFKYLRVHGAPLVQLSQVTLVSLGLAVVVALIVAMVMLRPPPRAPLEEARRLIDTVGWAAVLPQLLAALGAVFAAAGVGHAVAAVINTTIPLTSAFTVVAVYTVGMALFTIIMGNAFAAFPVMTAAIGLPLVIHKFGGNPAPVCAIGMLSGFCGTLMTPMAANFNVVPAALLELPNRYGVIRVQAPTGLILLACNTLLLYWLAFR